MIYDKKFIEIFLKLIEEEHNRIIEESGGEKG